jgi:hypothetical protein
VGENLACNWVERRKEKQARYTLHVLVANLEGEKQRVFQEEEHFVTRVVVLIKEQPTP